jgi:DNA polymerase-3 subunit delta
MIIFLYGEDTFRAQEKIKQFKDKFIRDVDPVGSSMSYIDVARDGIKDLKTRSNSASLFARRRMVIISNPFSDKDCLDEIKDNFSQKEVDGQDDNIFIFHDPSIKSKGFGARKKIVKVSGGRENPLNKKEKGLFEVLSASKYAEEFPLLSSTEALRWVKDRAAQKGANIEDSAAKILVGYLGSDLWRMNNELEKLAAYRREGAITVDDIKLVVKEILDDDIFKLTDALSANDKRSALRIMEEQFDMGVSEHYILSMLIWQVKTLMRIKQAVDAGDPAPQIAKKLKIHPFLVQKNINQVRKFKLADLRRALDRLVGMDARIKTGMSELKIEMDNFLINV